LLSNHSLRRWIAVVVDEFQSATVKRAQGPTIAHPAVVLSAQPAGAVCMVIAAGNSQRI
jgi:hypothetical protein